jgi:hypothetical protein
MTAPGDRTTAPDPGGDCQSPRPVADGPPGESQAERRHRTLTELKRTVVRHPAVDAATGIRTDEERFRELDVAFDPLILGVDAAEAGLRIEWRPRPDHRERAYFVFHYYDSTGRDFGWHREPNPHVEGLTHYQERETSGSAYSYRTASFDVTSPVEQLVDAETARRLRLLEADLESEPLDLAAPGDADIYLV